MGIIATFSSASTTEDLSLRAHEIERIRKNKALTRTNSALELNRNDAELFEGGLAFTPWRYQTIPMSAKTLERVTGNGSHARQ